MSRSGTGMHKRAFFFSVTRGDLAAVAVSGKCHVLQIASMYFSTSAFGFGNTTSHDFFTVFVAHRGEPPL